MSLLVPRAAATVDYATGGIYAFSTVVNAWSYQTIPGLAHTDQVTVKGAFVLVHQLTTGLLFGYCAFTNTWATATFRVPSSSMFSAFIDDGIILSFPSNGRFITFRGADATWNVNDLPATPLPYQFATSGNLLVVRAGGSGQIYVYNFIRGTWSSYLVGPTSASDASHVGISIIVTTCIATGTVHAYSAARDAWTVQATPGLSSYDKPVACDWMAVIVVSASKTIFSFNVATGVWSAMLMLGASNLTMAAMAPDSTVVASDFVAIVVPAAQTIYTMKSGDAAWGVMVARGLTPNYKLLVG